MQALRKLLRDAVILTTAALVACVWAISTCSAGQMKGAWQLPVILTVVWFPILVWRAWMILRAPRRRSPGYDRGPAAASGYAYIAASLVALFGIALELNFLGHPERWRGGLIALALCMLPLVIIFCRLIWVRSALGRAELAFDAPLRSGHETTATYRRSLRSGKLNRVDVQLSSERNELKIAIGSGHTVLYKQAITPVIAPAADRIEIKIPLHVAKGSSPSARGDVRITWWLRIRLHMKGCPNTTSSFEIEVI